MFIHADAKQNRPAVSIFRCRLKRQDGNKREIADDLQDSQANALAQSLENLVEGGELHVCLS
ncbi:MAG: hypothetical protein RR365_11670, partial [Bacteroides sp.]